MADLDRSVLHDLHLELGGRMVPFAGHELPVQYAAGVMQEHLQCRERAALFDVSHMGQVILAGDAPAAALERLVPADLQGLAAGRQRYGLFTAAGGGILDDLMVASRGADLFLVVNAARKAADLALLEGLEGVELRPVTGRALLALQGPAAEAALAAEIPDVAAMRFMDAGAFDWRGADLWVSRSGYSGEDGFEISLPEDVAEEFARALLAQEAVAPAGLGARDSLRLEAGLCLYGSDIDETTNPAEAGLGWAIPKVRRPGGAREGGFPGADVILRALEEGPARRRVGLLPEGRAPMRAGTPLFAGESGGEQLGHVTSGGFGPSLGRPVAMGYVPAGLAAPGTQIWGEVRGRRLPATIAALPFRPTTYKR